MNFRKLMIPAIFFAGIFFTACSKTSDTASPCNTALVNMDTLTVQHQLKGWELYSWPACNNWYYAIVKGTNSLKTYEEVTGNSSSSIKVWGAANLKAVLHQFPAGENIFWAGEGWLQKTWTTNYGNLHLPPASIVLDLQQYSTTAGLVLTVGN